MNLTNAELHRLRIQYGSIRNVEPGSQTHREMAAGLKGLHPGVLLKIEKAGIRWLSPIAKSIREGKPIRQFPGAETHIRDNGRGFL